MKQRKQKFFSKAANFLAVAVLMASTLAPTLVLAEGSSSNELAVTSSLSENETAISEDTDVISDATGDSAEINFPAEDADTVAENPTDVQEESAPEAENVEEAVVEEEVVEEGTVEEDVTEAAVPEKETAVEAEKAVDETVTIIHTNDMHGRMVEGNGVLGAAKLKTFVDSVNPTILVDAGDAFQGLAVSNFSEGRDMANIMNAIGYDAMAVGNHEFDFGLDVALEYKDILNFPLLSANTYRDGELLFEPSTVVEKDGYQVGIIGLTTPETATKTHPNNVVGVTFSDPLEAAVNEIEELLDANSNLDFFVIAGHLGVDETTQKTWRGNYVAEELSKEFPDLQIVFVDGHSHTQFATGEQFGNVIYGQTGEYLNNVGEITLNLTDATQSSGVLHAASELQELAADETVAGLVANAEASFAQWGSEVLIPNSPVFFNGQREYNRTQETNLGNIIADAMLAYGQTGFGDNQTDFAVTNGGGIRENIKEGPITRGDIITVLPFGNNIAQIKVTGAQVREMFEFSLRSDAAKDAEGNIILGENGQPLLGQNGGFLQVSKTVKLYYDTTKTGTIVKDNVTESIGERVLQIEIYDRTVGDFVLLDDTKTYNMATNDFLAAGGDGYTMLGGERQEGITLDEVFIQYLQAATTLRLYDADTNVDLNDYAEELPQTRLISISQADFDEMNKEEEEEEKEATPTPTPTPNPDEDKDGQQAGDKDSDKDTDKDKDKDGNKKPNYPQTGETASAFTVVGIVLMAGGSALYFWKKGKKAS